MIDSENPLYLMAKPPGDVASVLATDPRSDHRDPGLHHLTLMPLGIRSPGLLERAAAALDVFPEEPFRVAFDRIHSSGQTVALCGSEAIRGAIRLQAALRRFLGDRGLRLPAYRFHPHITLAYRPDNRGMEAIDAISWRVEEILLIESLRGRGRHREHGRWRLRAPPGGA